MKVIITEKSNLFLILIATSVLFLGFSIDSFADSHTTQSNALASYNNATNQIDIEWDFNTLDPGTRCVMKADFNFNDNLNTETNTNVQAFIPTIYSSVSSTPIFFEATNQSGLFAEEVNCSDSFKIDVDTILNDSTNVNDLIGFETFITFYILNNDGDFSSSDSMRIDELYIMYDPVNVVTQSTIDYACGTDPPYPQIGNVLYIDASGSNGSIAVHTNNAGNSLANCSEYVYTNSQQWVDISDTGVITDGLHPETFPLLYLVSYPVAAEATGGGGSSNDHKSRPTFGLDHNTYVQAVDVGLSINDVSFMVTDNYWTPIPMQNLTIGDVQNFTATTYAPKTLHFMEFLFGVPAVGEWDKAESTVTIEFDYRGDIIEIMPKNTDDIIINYNTMNYSSSIAKCKTDSNTPTCNKVSIEVIFNEAPIGTVMALQAIDYKGRTNILYFNDGLDLDGDSKNPPLTMEITSPVKYKGVQTIQRVDKVNDTWMTLDDDEPVSIYQRNSFGTFNPIEWRTVVGTSDEISEIMNRYHSEFSRYVESEHVRAVEVFDSSLIQGITTPSFAYEFKQKEDRQTQLSELIDSEIKRANVVFSEKYTIE